MICRFFATTAISPKDSTENVHTKYAVEILRVERGASVDYTTEIWKQNKK